MLFLLCLFTLISCLTGFSQSIVSTDSQNKKVILEEYTGIHCTYCPDGHEIAESIKDQYPDDVLLKIFTLVDMLYQILQ